MLTSLETTKLVAFDITNVLGMSEALRVPLANGIAGLVSSLLSQSVFVPIDVVRILASRIAICIHVYI
jgi:solute carrier family 25 protein 44